MDPVLIILLAWLAVDVVLVGSATLFERHRARRLDVRVAEMVEQAELHANH